MYSDLQSRHIYWITLNVTGTAMDITDKYSQSVLPSDSSLYFPSKLEFDFIGRNQMHSQRSIPTCLNGDIHMLEVIHMQKGNMLARWGGDKMAIILQTKFSNAFSSRECVKILFRIALKFAHNCPINDDNEINLVESIAFISEIYSVLCCRFCNKSVKTFPYNTLWHIL